MFHKITYAIIKIKKLKYILKLTIYRKSLAIHLLFQSNLNSLTLTTNIFLYFYDIWMDILKCCSLDSIIKLYLNNLCYNLRMLMQKLLHTTTIISKKKLIYLYYNAMLLFLQYFPNYSVNGSFKFGWQPSMMWAKYMREDFQVKKYIAESPRVWVLFLYKSGELLYSIPKFVFCSDR